MADLTETPRGNRIHIAVFGLRNAGKSTLVNALIGQPVALVSEVAGTTTDPVSKTMEIRPLGPCLITDTAGLDDVGTLGEMRVRRTREVLSTADVVLWVASSDADDRPYLEAIEAECRRRNVAVLVYRRGESVDGLKNRIAALTLGEKPPPLLAGLIAAGARVVCVCPIDASAPMGRLILPQQQVIRACLDVGAFCTVCQPETLGAALRGEPPPDLVVTDSQAFAAVRRTILAVAPTVRLTSFSILFARQKGNLAEYERGLRALDGLCAGARVLVAEGCTHHRQCADIGTVKLPKALRKLAQGELAFSFASGRDFPLRDSAGREFDLVVQCGGCMLTRREVQERIAACRRANVPIVNYGMVLAAASGIRLVSGSPLVRA